MLAYQLVNSLPALVVRDFSDAARVDNADVRQLTLGDLADTNIGELTCDCGRLSEI